MVFFRNVIESFDQNQAIVVAEQLATTLLSSRYPNTVVRKPGQKMSDMKASDRRQCIVNDMWVLSKPVHAGRFTQTWTAKVPQSDKHVTVKLERKNSPKKLLQRESSVYGRLQDTAEKPVGIPEQRFCGKHLGSAVLVTSPVGPSLEQASAERAFPMKNILKVGIQGLSRLECVHKRGIVHQDVNPLNLFLGTDDADTLYLANFESAARYQDVAEKQPHITEDPSVGSRNIDFLSVDAHQGATASRRDDLISLGYTLVHLWKGSLPWTCRSEWGMTQREALDAVCSSKRETSLSELCSGMPDEVRQFLAYAERLGANEKPNYFLLRCLLRKALQDASFGNRWSPELQLETGKRKWDYTVDAC